MMRAVASALLLAAGEALRESTTVQACSTPGCVSTPTTTGPPPLQESKTVRLGSTTTASPGVAIGATTVQESTTGRPCPTRGCGTIPLQESTTIRPGSTTASPDVAIGATTVQESTTVRPCSTRGCGTTPLQESTTARACSTPGCGTTPLQESTTTPIDSPDVAIGAAIAEENTTVRRCSTPGCVGTVTTTGSPDVATGIILSKWQQLPSGDNLQVSCMCSPEAEAEEDEVVDIDMNFSLEELRTQDRVTLQLPEGSPLGETSNCVCIGLSDDGEMACEGKLRADDVPLMVPCTMDVELF